MVATILNDVNAYVKDDVIIVDYARDKFMQAKCHTPQCPFNLALILDKVKQVKRWKRRKGDQITFPCILPQCSNIKGTSKCQDMSMAQQREDKLQQGSPRSFSLVAVLCLPASVFFASVTGSRQGHGHVTPHQSLL